jgi:hypothetical protein
MSQLGAALERRPLRRQRTAAAHGSGLSVPRSRLLG